MGQPGFAKDAVKIGAILAVTDQLRSSSAEARTLEMLVENMNAKGGIQRA